MAVRRIQSSAPNSDPNEMHSTPDAASFLHRTSRAVGAGAPLGIASLLLLLTGCALTPSPAERAQSRGVTAVGNAIRSSSNPAPVHPPGPGSSPEVYLRFALLHRPEVAAAYDQWRASVYAIAPERALPDPKITFQADITDTLKSLMPGFMVDLLGPKKRVVMTREAVARSEVAHRMYLATLVSVTDSLRRSWTDLVAVDRSIALRSRMTDLMQRLTAATQASYETGRGAMTLEPQTDSIDASRKLALEIANLRDQQAAARSRFKAALGLAPGAPDPAWPSTSFTGSALPDDATLWTRILAENPELATLRSAVDMADASIGVASVAGTPDFSAGLMADLKMNPLLYRPTASFSLPIWRERIHAILEAAKSRHSAAVENLDARQLSLAAELADSLARLHSASRTIRYLDASAFPKIDRDLASSEAAYGTGAGGIDRLIQLRLMRLELATQRVEAERQRDLAFADVVRLAAGDLGAAPALTPRISSHSSQS